MAGAAYCTYFDYRYLAQGRLLIESLRSCGDKSPVYGLALDEAAHAAVASWGYPDVVPLRLDELEFRFPELGSAKADRIQMEYYFTLTPWLVNYVLDLSAKNEWVTYLDADMYFYSSTEPIYRDLERASIALVEHRFTWEQGWRLRYGRYNVAWVGFRNDVSGRDAARWWALQCLDWCFDLVSDGRFADQGYLDSLPSRFSGVVVVGHPGADLAPWNLRRHEISVDSDGRVTVDGQGLIFFHFHGLQRVEGRYYFKHSPYLARTSKEIRDGIYRPYCEKLESLQTRLEITSVPQPRASTTAISHWLGRAAVLHWLGRLCGDFVDVSTGSSE